MAQCLCWAVAPRLVELSEAPEMLPEGPATESRQRECLRSWGSRLALPPTCALRLSVPLCVSPSSQQSCHALQASQLPRLAPVPVLYPLSPLPEASAINLQASQWNTMGRHFRAAASSWCLWGSRPVSCAAGFKPRRRGHGPNTRTCGAEWASPRAGRAVSTTGLQLHTWLPGSSLKRNRTRDVDASV